MTKLRGGTPFVALTARLSKSANQTITKDTITVIVLDVVNDDPGGMALTPNALTIQRTGKYNIRTLANWTPHADVGVFSGSIRRNGSEIARTQLPPAPGGINTHLPITWQGELTIGDVIDVTGSYSGALPTPATLAFNFDSVFLSVTEP